MVLNTRPLDWESSTLTTRHVLFMYYILFKHILFGSNYMKNFGKMKGEYVEKNTARIIYSHEDLL